MNIATIRIRPCNHHRLAVVNYAIPVIKKLCLAEVDHLKARKGILGKLGIEN